MEHSVLENGIISVKLPERVDINTCAEIQAQLDELLLNNSAAKLQLSAEDTSYVSSFGLRMFLKLQKAGNLDSIVGVSKEVYEVFDLTGLDKAIKLVRSYEVDKQDTNELIGEDIYGYLYKKDADKLIRVFKEWVPESELVLDQENSQLAMQTAISNAITFDVVKTDKGLASIYSVDGFKTIRRVLAENPDSVVTVSRELIKQLKVVHATDIFEGKLPTETIRLCGLIDEKLDNFSQEEKEIIKNCVKMFSRNNHPIFESLDTRIIIYAEGTVEFLDLSMLRYGNDIFELAGIYRNLFDHGAFLGARDEKAEENFNRFLMDYVDSWDDEIIKQYNVVCKAFAKLLYVLVNDPAVAENIEASFYEDIRNTFVNNCDSLKESIMAVKNHQYYGNTDTSEYLKINITERTAIKAFRKKLLLKDISMEMAPGEMILLMGGSGAGKTTFLNAVTGYEKAKAKITKGDIDIYRDYDSIKHRLAFAPQQDLLRDDDTVYNTLKNAADMRLPVSTSKEDKEKEIQKMLDIFGLADLKNSSISSLSGGQRKRASIAVEFISDPILFFLDEPDSGLDGVMARSLMEDLRKITNGNKIIIVISHAPDRVIDLFDKIIVLAKSDSDGAGHLAFYGSPKEAREFFERDTMEQILRIVNRTSEGGEGRAEEFITRYKEWK